MRLASNDNLRVRRIDVEPSARPFESRSPLVAASPLGDRMMASLTARASDERFACVCLRASISYAREAAFYCSKAKR